MLVGDACGGSGGIAKFDRDFLAALPDEVEHRWRAAGGHFDLVTSVHIELTPIAWAMGAIRRALARA